MRFRLSTLLAVCLGASVLLMLNLTEQIREKGTLSIGSESEKPIYYPPSRGWGWPVLVYEKGEGIWGSRVYWQPWNIVINVIFGLSGLAVLGLSLEWLERRRERSQAPSRSS